MPRSNARRPVVVVLAVVVAAACLGLGLWQLRRLEERRALNATILGRRSAAPISIGDTSSGAGGEPYRR
ncbi:MAG: SURF1 family protein, partial [Actinomycetota bacterium]|nr:SURF1 family protein [Actinomycetota bacterium]